jgi:hypothetical protein
MLELLRGVGVDIVAFKKVKKKFFFFYRSRNTHAVTN